MISERQKKIAVFLPALHGGGAERTMLNLAGGIAGRGYAVDLVLSRADGPYLNEIPAGVRLIDLASSSTLKSLPALVRYLRRERPQAMVSALSRANLTAVLARRLSGHPRTLLVNEQNTLSKWSQKSKSWRFRCVPKLASYLYRWTTSVVAVSQGVADDLTGNCGIPADRVQVIHNPGITPQLEAKAQDLVEHPWFAANQPPVLLSVGSLTIQKDYGTLLRAFSHVRRRQPARLMILGEGSERESLESLTNELGLADDVSFPGFVDNPYAYMKRAAAFVLSSQWEGLPTVLVEALYCGVPLVATDCPSGPREILHEGKYGELVPVGDCEELGNAITRTLNGNSPTPPEDSWQPYALDCVVDRYLEVMVGGNSHAGRRGK